jgi:hypothetical protein
MALNLPDEPQKGEKKRGVYPNFIWIRPLEKALSGSAFC